MAYSEDHIALAAEYALGTLDADERAQVETMMAIDRFERSMTIARERGGTTAFAERTPNCVSKRLADSRADDDGGALSGARIADGDAVRAVSRGPSRNRVYSSAGRLAGIARLRARRHSRNRLSK
jgi:hypothetical protein